MDESRDFPFRSTREFIQPKARPERARQHIGGAASQLAAATEQCCIMLKGLRSRLTGRIEVAEAQPVHGAVNTELSLSDQLNNALNDLGIMHNMLEELHKEVSRG